LSRRLTLCHGGSVLIEPGDFAIAIVRRQRLSASWRPSHDEVEVHPVRRNPHAGDPGEKLRKTTEQFKAWSPSLDTRLPVALCQNFASPCFDASKLVYPGAISV